VARNLLAEALGQLLSDLRGLNLIEIDADLSDDQRVSRRFASDVVRAINENSPASQELPKAFLLVSEAEYDEARSELSDLIVERPTGELKYRFDDRIVVQICALESESARNSFSTALSKVFPFDDTEAELNHDDQITLLADVVLRCILNASQVPSEVSERLLKSCPWIGDSLIEIMRLLRDGYGALQKAVRVKHPETPPHVLWINHVNFSLEILVNVISRAKEGLRDDHDLAKLFERYLWAGFSLPTPDNLRRFEAKNFRDFYSTCRDYWSTTDLIRQRLKLIAICHLGGEKNVHPLSTLDWEMFDVAVERTEWRAVGPLYAFTQIERDNPERLELFASLFERNYFGPWVDPDSPEPDPVDEIKVQLSLRHEDGSPLTCADTLGELHFIESTVDNSSFELRSTDFHVVLSGLPEHLIVRLIDSGVKPILVGESGKFELRSGEFRLDAQSGELVSKAQIFRPVQGRFRHQHHVLGIKLPPIDSAELKKIRVVNVPRVVVLASDGAAAYLLDSHRERQGTRPINWVGSDEFDSNGNYIGGGLHSIELRNDRRYEVVIWGRDTPDAPKLAGSTLDAINGNPNLWIRHDYRPENEERITINGVDIVLVPENDNDPLHSPIIAAIEKRVFSPIPSESQSETLLGGLESLYSHVLARDIGERSIGHVVLPSDLGGVRVEAEYFSNMPEQSFMLPDVSELQAGKNRRRTFESVPPLLLDSPELQQFRASFDQLKLHDIIRDQVAQGLPGWMSRISLKHLHDTDQLRQYLQAYACLLNRAREIGNPWGILWASYPFAASVWATTPVVRLESVLLSPFHPIRLAWLAASEAMLSQVPRARAKLLALGIEGWNIPIFGPTEKLHEKCLAAPMDPGPDFEFLGWSQLVRDHPSRLPASIGGRPVPSASSGAISEASVRSALTVFNRIHPYLSSICVDLADTAPVSRALGVDRQVLEAARSQELALEVFDSIMRDGEIPQIAEDVPLDQSFVWKRYNPLDDAQGPHRAHIRILQSPNVVVSVEPQPFNRESRRGVVGQFPLRRFVVPDPPGSEQLGARSISGPSPYQVNLGGAFCEALQALEIGGESDQVQAISIQLPNQGGLVGESFLTVFGESHINPAAIAALFRENRENPMMVWEWSTPFRSDVRNFGRRTVIDSRSHYSIARIPIRYKEEVRQLLRSLVSDEPTVKDVDELLGVLGTRGVSLANLLASGETQALSALGFYVAYRLIDVLWNEETPTFILPLDICQGFIAALTNSKNVEESSKRSDLLAMTIVSNRVHFRIIELKYLKAGSPIEALPDVGDNEQNLVKGREQLRVVQSIFENVLMSWRENQGAIKDSHLEITDRSAAAAELRLIGNALAMLLEAGMKTCPSGAGQLDIGVQALRGLVDGTCELRLEDPLLLALYSLTTPDPVPRYGPSMASIKSQRVFEFITDPRMLMSQVASQGGPILDRWKEAMTTSPEAVFETNIVETQLSESTSSGAEGRADSNTPSFLNVANSDDVLLSTDNGDSVSGSTESETQLIQGEVESKPVSDKTSVSEASMRDDEKEPVQAHVEANNVTENIELPVIGDGIRIAIGRRLSTSSGSFIDYWPSNTRLNQFNVGVVGDLGTGKTQLLQSLVYQMRKEAKDNQAPPMSGLILDYKRDYQTPQFLEAVDGKALDPFRIPLDVFRVEKVDGVRALRDCHSKAREFADTIGKVYTIGAVQRQRLTKVVRELIQNSEYSPTMRDVHDSYLLEVEGGQDSVTSVLESFVFGEIFAEDPLTAKTMSELLENQVITLNLAGVGVDQNLKNALVALFLNEYYAHMLKLKKWKPVSIGDKQLRIVSSILLVDEATNIMSYEFEVLTQILQQGREFGVGVLLSSQYLSHFETTNQNYKEPLRTWFIHKVPQIKQRELQSLGVPHATAEDAARVSSLEKHQLYYVSLDFNGVFVRGTPFFEFFE